MSPAEAPPAPPRPAGTRRALLAAGVLVGGYAVLSVVGTAALLGKNCVRRPHVTDSLPSDLSPRARAIEFRTEDGYRIRGHYAPPVGEAPVAVVLHGRGRTRDNVLPWAHVLADAGYGVLSFDWRSHGQSDGNLITHGVQEPRDLAAALDFLQTLPEARDRPVGILAASLGASNAAMSAPILPPRVRCMFLDAPFGDLGRMAEDRTAFLGPLAFGPRLAMPLVSRLFLGRSAHEISPERNLKAFAPRPIVVTHGTLDGITPLAEGVSLHDAYPGPKELWLTEDKHCKSRETRTREYMRRVGAFFAAHLPHAPPVEVVLAKTPEKLEHAEKVDALAAMRATFAAAPSP